jgi:hypothetical protein
VWGLLTERYYGRTSYERLLSKARVPLNLIAATIAGAPRYAGRMLAAAILHHELFRPKRSRLMMVAKSFATQSLFAITEGYSSMSGLAPPILSGMA